MRRPPARPLGVAVALLLVAQLLVLVTGAATADQADDTADQASEPLTDTDRLDTSDSTTTLPPPPSSTTLPLDLPPAPPAPTTAVPAPTATTAPAPAPPTTAAPVNPTTSGCGPELVKDDGTPWRCTFVDDFEGTQLDMSKWSYQLTKETGFKFGGDCFTGDPRTHVVGGGTLQLRTILVPAFTCESNRRNEDYASAVQSAMVTTLGKWSQAFGRFEIRAKLPETKKTGIQTSFWLWPDNPTKHGLWPASGEIDMMEWYSRINHLVVPYFHYYSLDPQVNQTQTTYVCEIVRPEDWHTYTLAWTRSLLVMTIDGRYCLSHKINALGLQAPAPFDQPFSLNLTQGAGQGNNPLVPGETEFPATTTIDYVRVWQ